MNGFVIFNVLRAFLQSSGIREEHYHTAWDVVDNAILVWCVFTAGIHANEDYRVSIIVPGYSMVTVGFLNPLLHLFLRCKKIIGDQQAYRLYLYVGLFLDLVKMIFASWMELDEERIFLDNELPRYVALGLIFTLAIDTFFLKSPAAYEDKLLIQRIATEVEEFKAEREEKKAEDAREKEFDDKFPDEWKEHRKLLNPVGDNPGDNIPIFMEMPWENEDSIGFAHNNKIERITWWKDDYVTGIQIEYNDDTSSSSRKIWGKKNGKPDGIKLGEDRSLVAIGVNLGKTAFWFPETGENQFAVLQLAFIFVDHTIEDDTEAYMLRFKGEPYMTKWQGNDTRIDWLFPPRNGMEVSGLHGKIGNRMYTIGCLFTPCPELGWRLEGGELYIEEEIFDNERVVEEAKKKWKPRT
jgi:hypothetical protein